MSRTLRLLGIFTAVVGNGGIQRFNRNLLAASALVTDSVDYVARADGANDSPMRFLWQWLWRFLRGGANVLVVGHVNYLVVAVGLRKLRFWKNCRVFVIAHGLEVWISLTATQRWALSNCDRVLCVSTYTADRIKSQLPSIPDAVLQIFPNAISSEFTPLSKSTTERNDADDWPQRFFLVVTRLDPRERAKGVITTLEAFASIPDAGLKLLVIGDGADRPFLSAVAVRLGIDNRVRWMGPVDDSTLRHAYSKCIAFVLPSSQEGFGIVYLEAMSCGAPVIAAAEKGVLDVVQHEISGLLLPYGDVVALSKAMLRIDRDKALRERLRAGGLAQVTGTGPFTLAALATRWREQLTGNSRDVTKLSYKQNSVTTG